MLWQRCRLCFGNAIAPAAVDVAAYALATPSLLLQPPVHWQRHYMLLLCFGNAVTAVAAVAACAASAAFASCCLALFAGCILFHSALLFLFCTRIRKSRRAQHEFCPCASNAAARRTLQADADADATFYSATRLWQTHTHKGILHTFVCVHV